MSTPPELDCPLAGRCGGCPQLGASPLPTQRAAKIEALRSALAFTGPVALADVGAAGIRDRLDLQLRRDGATLTLGFGTLADPRALVDVATCPLASPALAGWYVAFRADAPPVARASVRLRVGFDGRRGLWLDLAHTDVKALLDERAWLARTAAVAAVELGPKARGVSIDRSAGSDGAPPRLVDPPLAPWSSTWLDAREVGLASRIADFTQPGRGPNRALVQAVMQHTLATGARRWLELGAGAGNLTLPLANAGRAVRAVELDGAALRANLAAQGLAASVEVVAASFTRAADVASLVLGRDAVLADPPRSGLGPFAEALGGLAPSLRPAHLVYVSCHVDALARDAAVLARAGYRAEAVDGVDQFPHGPHAEWVVTFSRAS